MPNAAKRDGLLSRRVRRADCRHRGECLSTEGKCCGFNTTSGPLLHLQCLFRSLSTASERHIRADALWPVHLAAQVSPKSGIPGAIFYIKDVRVMLLLSLVEQASTRRLPSHPRGAGHKVPPVRKSRGPPLGGTELPPSWEPLPCVGRRCTWALPRHNVEHANIRACTQMF